VKRREKICIAVRAVDPKAIREPIGKAQVHHRQHGHLINVLRSSFHEQAPELDVSARARLIGKEHESDRLVADGSDEVGAVVTVGDGPMLIDRPRMPSVGADSFLNGTDKCEIQFGRLPKNRVPGW